MKMLTGEFAARPALIRHAIDQHAEWIEKTLGAPLSQAVIVECESVRDLIAERYLVNHRGCHS